MNLDEKRAKAIVEAAGFSGKCRTVSIEEIKQDNPRGCIHPYRYFEECYKCTAYKTCDSIPPKDREKNQKAFNSIEEKKKRIRELKAELKTLQGKGGQTDS